MREINTIIKGNIRRGKGSFISILLLIFLVTMSLTTVLTVLVNSSARDNTAIEQAGLYDWYVMTNDEMVEKYGMTVNRLKAEIEATREVEKVGVSEIAYANIEKLSGKKGDDRVLMMPYDNGQIEYKVFKREGEGLEDQKMHLKEGEVFVPVAFQSLYHCKIGDMLLIQSGGGELAYKVAGYFEDPIMGSAMMGIKTILVSKGDMDALRSVENEHIRFGTFFNIKQSEHHTLSSLKFQQSLNKKTNIVGYADTALLKSQAVGYMLITVRIFGGILAAFIILLLIVVLIVLGHSINSSIEMEYQNIGILKSVGFTAGKLKAGIVLQYLLAVATGMIAGVPSAIPVIRMINVITRPITGLYVSDEVAVLPCAVSLAAILLLVVVFIMHKVRGISKITPLKAIVQEREDAYFSSRLQMQIRKKGLNLWLAIRQITSNKKQYVSACLITMLLTFFLITMSGMGSWMGDDGENLNQLYNCFENDIEVKYEDPSLQKETEALIKKETKITGSFRGKSTYIMLDGCQMYAYVCDQPEEYTTVYEGRTCKYDNEILITQFVADELGIGIGDRVPLALGNQKEEFLVSGIFQSSNDMGSNFAMNGEGYQRLAKKAPDYTITAYRLQDKEKVKSIIRKVQQIYTEQEVQITDAGDFSGIELIVTAIQGISLIVYVIAAIFALTAVSIVAAKIFAREKKDYGIYKALGFSSSGLKIQFAARFALVACIGTLFGAGISALLSVKCLLAMLSAIGVSRIEEGIGFASILIPCVFMIVVFFAAAYVKAGRMRKIKPTILIGD